MKAEVARVYLLDIPYHADKLYDYYVSPELSKKVQPGVLVSVPFGGGNRHVAAVVFEISDHSEFESLKPIFSVSSEGVLLDDEQRRLCSFVKEHTLCTMGEAIHAAVPSAAFSRITEYVKVSENKHPDALENSLPAGALALYNYIFQKGQVALSKLSDDFSPDYGRFLAPLVRERFVERFSAVKEPTNKKKNVTVSLSMTKEDTEDIISGASRAAVKLRSPMQALVLRTLAQNGPLEINQLVYLTGCSKAQVASLEKRGLVKLDIKDSFRNPYAEKGKEGADDIILSEEQSAAFAEIERLYEERTAKAALLHGVTGSGKTSVIKKMIDRVRLDGKGVIMLVPEIALTPQAVAVFCGYYGDSVSVLHSRLSVGERFDAWRRIKDGLSDIVIGTRSAIFAPLKNIGLIVIDEEQENTYKSETNPKYLAHDVAAFRCMEHNALMLLASATPSVISYNKAVNGRYSLIKLKNRYGGATLPKVEISDMRSEAASGNTSPVGITLLTRLSETVDEGKQAIVFLNRRGYNSSVTCMSCGEVIMCPECSVAMTYHIRRSVQNESDVLFASDGKSGVLMCHYCGHTDKVPDKCPSCGKEHFRYIGCGTERLEEELKRLIPGVKISRMDMDTTSGKMSHEDIIEEFRSGKTNILLGTQMVTKGHDFPRVTLVGVLGADLSLHLDDYRAAERTFSMLTQVIGRAGRRGGDEGLAVIQTVNPYSEVMRDAVAQDYESFFEREIRLRRNLAFPPFCDMVQLTLSSPDEALLASSATKLSEELKKLLSVEFPDIGLQAFGPFETPVYKVRNVCRMRMVLKCRLNNRTRAFLSKLLSDFGKNTRKQLTLSVDFNPASL